MRRLPLALRVVTLPLLAAACTSIAGFPDLPNVEDSGANDGNVADSGSSSSSGSSSGSGSGGSDSGSSSGSDSGSGSGGLSDSGEAGPDASDGAPVLCDPSKPFGSLQSITELNTAGDNAGVWLMPNQLAGYTQSTRGGNWAIFSTSRTTLTSLFSTPAAVTALNQTPGTGAFDGSPSPRGDGLYVLFQSNRSGHNQIWSASRASTSVSFGSLAAVAALGSSSDDISPWLSPDGQVMYFSSDRSGLYSIWTATWNGTDFNAPSLVSELSPSGLNQFPILTPDQLVVYWLGPGGIMVATRAATTDHFSNATVVTELASLPPNGGGPIYITPDRCTIYGSTRPSGTTSIVTATKSP